jgi:hypothetical protein
MILAGSSGARCETRRRACRILTPLPRCAYGGQKPVGKLFFVVCAHGADANLAAALEVAHKAPCVGCCLCCEYSDKDPEGRPVDGD